MASIVEGQAQSARALQTAKVMQQAISPGRTYGPGEVLSSGMKRLEESKKVHAYVTGASDTVPLNLSDAILGGQNSALKRIPAAAVHISNNFVPKEKAQQVIKDMFGFQRHYKLSNDPPQQAQAIPSYRVRSVSGPGQALLAASSPAALKLLVPRGKRASYSGPTGGAEQADEYEAYENDDGEHVSFAELFGVSSPSGPPAARMNFRSESGINRFTAPHPPAAAQAGAGPASPPRARKVTDGLPGAPVRRSSETSGNRGAGLPNVRADPISQAFMRGRSTTTSALPNVALPGIAQGQGLGQGQQSASNSDSSLPLLRSLPSLTSNSTPLMPHPPGAAPGASSQPRVSPRTRATAGPDADARSSNSTSGPKPSGLHGHPSFSFGRAGGVNGGAGLAAGAGVGGGGEDGGGLFPQRSASPDLMLRLARQSSTSGQGGPRQLPYPGSAAGGTAASKDTDATKSRLPAGRQASLSGWQSDGAGLGTNPVLARPPSLVLGRLEGTGGMNMNMHVNVPPMITASSQQQGHAAQVMTLQPGSAAGGALGHSHGGLLLVPANSLLTQITDPDRPLSYLQDLKDTGLKGAINMLRDMRSSAAEPRPDAPVLTGAERRAKRGTDPAMLLPPGVSLPPTQDFVVGGAASASEPIDPDKGRRLAEGPRVLVPKPGTTAELEFKTAQHQAALVQLVKKADAPPMDATEADALSMLNKVSLQALRNLDEQAED